MSDFKPHDVVISVPCPLAGTMGRVEVEFAASMIVRGLQENGNDWKPIAWPDIARVLRADIASRRDPFFSLCTNPFLRPDVDDLIKRGFGRWVVERPQSVVEFTAKRDRSDTPMGKRRL